VGVIMAVLMKESYFSKSNNVNNVKLINPSLFIGIGGTGKSVMEAFRKKIVNQFGSLDNLPIIQFLYHDQDLNYRTCVNHEAAYEDIKFNQDELVIDKPTNFMAYKPPALKNHPHIEEWLNEDLYDFPLPKVGCDYRTLGRLSFFDNCSQSKNLIYNKLDHAINSAFSLVSIQKAMLTLNANVGTNNLNVYFIFSIAGGQGSGAFLDYAYFIKEKFKNYNPVNMSYIFLPSFFSQTDTADQRRINGYAALKELEHFNCRWNDFKIRWSSDDPVINLGYAPFDYNNIFGDINNNKCRITYSGAVEMVAESIYQDFDTNSFANIKRSIRANHGSALGSKFIAIEQGTNSIETENYKKFLYSTFYTSSSLIKIYMPIDDMKNYLIYEYMNEVFKNIDFNDKEIKKIILENINKRLNKYKANFIENKGADNRIINLFDEKLLNEYKSKIEYSKIKINYEIPVFDIVAYENKKTVENLISNIFNQIKPYFMNVRKDFDIIDYIVANSNSGKIITIQTIARLASPMYLANDNEFKQKKLQLNARNAAIALCKKDDTKESHAEFFKQLKDYGLSLDGSNLVKNDNDSTYILIFTETAGFPLAYLKEIEEMKKEYIEDRMKTRSFSHIQKDYDKFRDILIWKVDEYRNQAEN